MKSKKLIPVLLIILAIPFVTFAFSWKSMLFWQKPVIVEPIAELNPVEILNANEKYSNWEKAFNKTNLNLDTTNPQNLTLSESELNYMVKKSLATLKNPPIQDLKIDLLEGEVEISGYLLSPFRGSISAIVKPVYSLGKLSPEVTKVRFKKLYFPKRLANRLLSKQLEPSLNLLYSDSSLKDLQIIIRNDRIQIKL